MGTWIKHFKDGSEEHGDDRAVTEGRASWSQGKLDKIKECTLTGFEYQTSVALPNTEWHQFDRMEVPVAVGKHKPIRRERVIQAKIKIDHIGSFIEEVYLAGSHRNDFRPSSDRRHFGLLEEIHDFNTSNVDYIEIEPKHLDKWFTIMIDDIGIHISFAEKGKV